MEKAGAQIAFAVAARDAVHGQHHDLNPGVFGPLQHGAVEAAILVEVELIDLWGIMRFAQLLEAHRAERGYAEHCAVSRGCSGHGAFALMVEETLQGGRRAIDRQGELLAHDGNGEINSLDAAQHVGHEIAVLEACRIAPVGDLVVGRTVDVVEDRARQPSLRQPSEIMKVVAVPKAHGPLRSPCSRSPRAPHRAPP